MFDAVQYHIARSARGLHRDLEVALERRLMLFLIADVAVLVFASLQVLLASDPRATLYPLVVVLPLVLLGIPALADSVGLERRAGCLELALTLPAPERYFLRRIARVVLVLAAQGVVVVLVTWLVNRRELPLVPVLLSALLAAVFVGCVVLLWASRLRSVTSVWFSSLATVGVFSSWLLENPVPPRSTVGQGQFFAEWTVSLEWATNAGQLAAASIAMFLWSRRWLRQTERLLW